jgi:hypothetical protein
MLNRLSVALNRRRSPVEKTDPEPRSRSRLKAFIAGGLLAVLALVSFSAWALSSPIGSSPDDQYHLASIWCATGERPGLCEEGTEPDNRQVSAALVETSVCYAFKSEQSGACQAAGGDDPDLVVTDAGNFTGDYPPVFYATMSVFASEHLGLSVLAMRMFNALVFVVTIGTLVSLTAARLRPVVLWSVLATIVPLGMFIVPSTNPSSWAYTSAAAVFIAVMGYLRAEERWRTVALGAIAAFAVLIGSGARADAAVYAGVAIAGAVLLTWRRERSYLWRLALPVLLVAVAVAFYLSTGQSELAGRGLRGDTTTGDLSRTLTNLLQVPDLIAGAFGRWGLGWLDTPMWAIVWVLGLMVFGATIVLGFAVLSARKLIVLLTVAAVTVALPVMILVRSNALVGEYVQPRYILPLLVILVAVALIPLRDRVRLTVAQAVLLAAAVSVAQAAALHAELRRYVVGTDTDRLNLDASIEWWWGVPWSPNATWFVGTLAFTAIVAVLTWLFLRTGRVMPATHAVAVEADARSDRPESADAHIR